MPYATLRLFVQPYSARYSQSGTVAEVIDLENPPPSKGSQLPCPAAIEFLADIYEVEGGDSLPKATEVHHNALLVQYCADEVVVMEIISKRV
jgi:protein farnesyltransferase/geranylgeranyltransferase type-1 subunit alpha